jgi:hypothetical protein
MLLSSISSWPFPQTIDLSGEAAKDKHSCLLQKFVNYRQKKVYNIGPWGTKVENFYYCHALHTVCDKLVVVPVRLHRPSLIFAGKARSLS